MQKKKIFITGIAGFLGSHLADVLLSKGHEVSGCDNLVGGYMDNVPKNAVYHEADCGDLEKMTEILKDIDIVYHTACTAHEGLSVFSPTNICRNTYQITIATATAAIRCGVKRFVNCSSMARYGKQEVIPFTEDLIPKPQDPYAISKLAAENCLDIFSQVHGIEVVHAIPHNIIGSRQKYDDPFRNVASIMINLILQGRQPIIYGDGEQQRCFSFVDDVIDCMVKLGFQDNVVGERINIGPDEEFVTINQLAEVIAELLDFKLDPIYVPDRPQEVKVAVCSADKARKLLGYSTKKDLKEGLKEMVCYIKDRGVRKFDYHMDVEIINEKTPKTWSERLF